MCYNKKEPVFIYLTKLTISRLSGRQHQTYKTSYNRYTRGLNKLQNLWGEQSISIATDIHDLQGMDRCQCHFLFLTPFPTVTKVH